MSFAHTVAHKSHHDAVVRFRRRNLRRLGPEFPLNDFFGGTTVGTTESKRVRVEPGIYKRGRVYDIRVSYTDRNGYRHQRWETVTEGIREARNRLVLLNAAAKQGNLVSKPAGRPLTVAAFLTGHYLPHLYEERVAKTRTMSKNTAKSYRRYIEKKIIPAIGNLRVTDVHSGHIEAMLNNLVAGGRDTAAGKGRPARYPQEVYDLILSYRDGGWKYSDIAALVTSHHAGIGVTLSKDAVASICRRRSAPPAKAVRSQALAVETVRKVYWMLKAAWAFGVKHELIPRDRAYVITEATCPTEGRWATEPTKLLWEPTHYGRFFDWAVHHRPESWVGFYFVATSGDRISGNLGLGWSEVDLDQATAKLVRFVKYHGEPGERVLVERIGKTGPGHEIILDPRTVEVLRAEKARQSEQLLARGDRHTCTTVDRDCPLAGYHDRGLVFPQKDGNYRNPNNYLRLFKDAIRAFNREHPDEPLPVIDLHALRHGWGTTAEAVEVSERVQMDRLGHKSVRVSRRYAQLREPAKAAAAAAVSDALFADSIELRNLGS